MAEQDPPAPTAAVGQKAATKRAAKEDNKDVLVCDICMELYNDSVRQPKFLACHHSYCKSCLVQVANGKENVECPSCRQVTRLTSGGVAALQTNFYIGQLQDTLKQAGAERAKGCKKHFNQPMSFFCSKCCLLICRDCTVLDHKQSNGHSIQDIVIADPEQRDQLKVKVTNATATFQEVQGQLGLLEAETQNIRASREELQTDISAACERYNKMVELRKVQLLKEITDTYNSRQAEIIHNAEAMGSRLKKMAKTLSNAERLTRQGTLNDVIVTSGNLDQITSDLKELILNMDLGTNNLLFDGTEGEADFQTSVAKLGRLRSENNLPARVLFVTPDMTAGLVTCVSVEVFNSEQKPFCAHGVDIIIRDQEGHRLPKTITWADDGKGSFVFTPQTSGEIRLQGTFYGRLIKGGNSSVMVASNNPVSKFGRQGTGEGTFHSPRAICINEEGLLYVADTGNRVIQKLDSEGRFLGQIEIAQGDPHNSTCDLALCDNENLVVCTQTAVGSVNNPTSGNTVLLYTKDGELQHKFNSKSMKCALCVATNRHDEIIVSDYLKHCLYMYDKEGTLIRKIGHPNGFNHPAFICVTEDDHIIVTDTNMNTVQVYDREGQFLRKFGKSGSKKGHLKQPFGVASDGQHILVVDSGNSRIQVYRMDGTFVSAVESVGDPLDQPRGIALTGDGHCYVADRDNHCIKKYRYK